jgi:hypothetical protein
VVHVLILPPMAAPITTDYGWTRLAAQQLLAEGVLRKDGRMLTVRSPAHGPLDDILNARVAALKERDAVFPAEREEMLRRHAQERATLKQQAAQARASLAAQVDAAADDLKIRQEAEARALAARRHLITSTAYPRRA